MTEKQEKWYLEHGGQDCPFCHGHCLIVGSFEADGAVLWQNVRCSTCDKEWTDQYTLTGASEPEGYGDCPTCGEVHPPCSMCGKPTRCPPDEPGEPFSMCDACDAELAATDGGA